MKRERMKESWCKNKIIKHKIKLYVSLTLKIKSLKKLPTLVSRKLRAWVRARAYKAHSARERELFIDEK